MPNRRFSNAVVRASYPVQDYACLGDGRSIALVAPDGEIAWWGVPAIDSDPMFDSLLDPDVGGFFQLQPTEPFEVERQYRPDSNVLETTFTTRQGVVRVSDSLNSTFAGRLPWCELARRIEALSGCVPMRMQVVFGTRAGTVSPWLSPNPNGCTFHVGPVLGQVRATPNVTIIDENDRSVVAEAALREGDRALVCIIAGENQPLAMPPLADVDKRIDVSDEAWRVWADELHYDGPYRDAVRRSALALKLLLYSPSGAIAAAATTSLPERVGGSKNWDYRYAWVRDACHALAAFVRLGALSEAQAALQWLMHRLGDTGPTVCYRLDGGQVPPVTALDLSGYRGSRPVVKGNVAGSQHQHGTYGDILQAASLFVRVGNVLDQKTCFVLSAFVDECADRWRTKDAGIWELEDEQHYTQSKVSCWQALSRAVELANEGHLPETCVPRWTRERERIATWIDEHCWSERKKAYTFFAGTDRLDASLVLAVRFGFPNRDRLSATLDAIRSELGHRPSIFGHSPWIYRYSGAEKEEGAFLACTFWFVEALAELGRHEEASSLMDQALSALPAGVGTLAEMVETETGDMIGNVPQGLSHLALIHAAQSLNDAVRP